LPPPKNSYASTDTDAAEIGVWFLEILPGGRITLPIPKGGSSVHRRAYFLEGKSISIDEQSIPVKSMITLNTAADGGETEIWNNAEENTRTAEILILQGKPLNEPVVQHGPFVMNSQQEIAQAFRDYEQTQFGGWPWPKDAMVFPKEKGRFALTDGQETFPPKKN
jgi:redox-sensitive bicupin YhaK (pirin superfamily)